MNNLGVIVQARTSSARLPNKVVLPFYRNKSIIEIIIEKLKKLDLKIYVATSKKKSDDIIEKICNKVRVTCYRGDEHNVLSRFILIAEQNNLSHAVRVCCDNPFINIELLNKLILNFKSNHDADYISYFDNLNNPSIKSHVGIFCEIFSYKSMKLINSLTMDQNHLEHATSYIYENPKKFKIIKIKKPILLNNKWLRLTVDTKDDFDVVSRIFNNFKGDRDSIKDLIHFIKNDEQLIEKMTYNINTNKK